VKRKRWIGFVTVMLLLCAWQGRTQSSKKEPQLRTVSGVVTDKEEKPIANGVVFLKNLRTNVVLSHFTGDDGAYRFSGLDPNVDYEIHAEAGAQKSASRTVTALDSRKEITLNLKLDKKKGD
jgi:hypothetical protein